MTHGERLRQRRLQYGHAAGLENGYTAAEIRAVMGVEQCTLSQYETNTRRVPLARMLALCTFYGVALEKAFPEYRPSETDKAHHAAATAYRSTF